jgi:2-alkyl-3-oxoalkanoate reductase
VRVLVTGAAGFVGRAVVTAAAAAGHDVVALVRPATVASDVGAGIRVVHGDLRQRGSWCDEVRDVDAVIHLAAAASGAFTEQFAGTVVATENLLAALDLDGLSRFVHVSSFSVYDMATLPAGAALDEGAPLETRPERRDAYTATKLIQERMVREACADRTELVIVRPGAIYGPGKEWDHGAAMRVGPVAVVLGASSPMRLTFVDNCADALVAALSSPDAAGEVVNVVDDEAPTHLEYFRRCRAVGATSARPLPVPWWVVDAVGRAVDLLDRLALGRRAKLPELLAHRRQQARWKPFRYPNAHARAVLGWSPAVDLDTGVQRMVDGSSGR